MPITFLEKNTQKNGRKLKKRMNGDSIFYKMIFVIHKLVILFLNINILILIVPSNTFPILQ